LTQKRFPKKGKRTWQIKEKKVRKEKTQKSKSSRPDWNEKNKKRTLFDEKHQVKNKTNTTKKVHGFILTKK